VSPKVKAPLVPWTEWFSRSSRQKGQWFVRNTRGLNSSWKENARWTAVKDACRRLGVKIHGMQFSGPGMSDDYTRHAVFLDGGVTSTEGGYFFGSGQRGAWVVGRRALRLLCYELGLTQPSRGRAEDEIPSRAMLRSELTKQLSTTEGRAELRERCLGWRCLVAPGEVQK
jgi:hypothetical protein